MEGAELVLTSEEWEELFGDPPEADPKPKRRPLIRFVATLAALGVLITGVTATVSALRNEVNLSDNEILPVVSEVVEESPYGWLVTGIVVEPMNAGIGGFVLSNPPDGVIHISDTNWPRYELVETTAHEIGHLVAFAIFGADDQMPGGLEVEVWAECAAVENGDRPTDRSGSEQYSCTRDDLALYRASIDGLQTVCAPWIGECRNLG